LSFCTWLPSKIISFIINRIYLHKLA
jgi:hypothetical protein